MPPPARDGAPVSTTRCPPCPGGVAPAAPWRPAPRVPDRPSPRPATASTSMAPLYDRLVISFTIVKEFLPQRTRGEAPMDAATAEPAGSSTTRERLVEAAVRLFTRHGFAGTSLQM